MDVTLRYLAVAAAILVGSGAAANAQGDPEQGAKVFNKCRTCHVADEERNRVGPHLVGLFGRLAGTVEGFKYSVAMEASGVVWDERTLAAFVADPRGFIPGNRMAFAGLKEETEIADLIAYLQLVTIDSGVLVLGAWRDSFIRRGGASNRNEGAHPSLGLARSGLQRTLVAYNEKLVEAFVESRGLSAATLVLAIAENGEDWDERGAPVDAHPLLEDFAEGNAAFWQLEPPDRIAGEGAGVTWRCAVDDDISNNIRDCDEPWDGGTYDAPSAPSALHDDRLEGEVAWDVTDDVLDGHAAWLIRKVDERVAGTIVYHSKEGALAQDDLDLRPRLILEELAE